MRAPAVSFAKRFVAAFMAALLTVTLLPASALAEGEGDSADASAEEPQEISALQPDASSGVAPMLASGLVGNPTAFVSADVALDGEPVIGSFTVDGLTFAVVDGMAVKLVGVSSDWQQVANPQEDDGSPVAPMLASGPDGSTLALPESVAYEGIDYAVTSIGAYAFYLSGVTSVELPASIAQVDDRAFRSSDVASVSVADGNPTYSSFDGALYDADQSSLLLIPEGKQGTVLLPKTAESASPSVFSHCPLVTQVSVEEGSAAFASENGLLYDASLTTLLRVPAGATDIVIRDGCITIAAGAMEACASLATITAPASVTSISPDVFTSVPTVSLPANAIMGADDKEAKGEESPAQLNAMVALQSTASDSPEVNAESIAVDANEGESARWRALGFSVEEGAAQASLQDADAFSATIEYMTACYFGKDRTLWGYYPDRNEYGSYDSASNVLTVGDAWLVKNHGLGTQPTSSVITVQYSSQYGWYLLRNTEGLEYRIWVDSKAEAITPTLLGEPLAIGNSVWNDSAYFWSSDLVRWNPNGGSLADEQIVAIVDSAKQAVAPKPERDKAIFLGWYTAPTGGERVCGAGETITREPGCFSYYAHWAEDFDISFDVDSEPGDEDYPGEAKDDQTIVVDQIEAGDKVEIADPKRPGYVFQGWVIPNADGTEAIEQDLVYKDETDGKWYVDASKLPDYANDEGRVELTARWTSVISVDVPSAVTFYADVVTQGNESREGAASSAFGQNKVASQSEVDLRIVGLESTAVATEGTTLGADSILKKSDAATPSSSTQKLFSLYPTDKALTADDLQDPDAVSATKPADAVDFALDDLLLERSFAADSFTIPAGDTLNLGYRLNLSETGTELDYDKLSALDEGASASIANISYTFAADYNSPADWGEPLWIENPDTSEGAPRFLVLDDIKAAAEDLAEKGESSPYFATYDALMRAVTSDMVKSQAYDGDSQHFFQMRVGDSYAPVQIIGICDDVRADGKKAGLTFQFKNAYRATGQFYPNTNAATYGWHDGTHPNAVREWLQGDFWSVLPSAMQDAIAEVVKYQQVYEEGAVNALPTTAKGLQGPTVDTLFLPSAYEVFGDALLRTDNGFTEVYFSNYGSEALTTVSGYVPMRYDWYATKKRIMYTALDGIERAFQGELRTWWLRSAHRSAVSKANFLSVYYGGSSLDNGGANAGYGVVPCFAL